MKTTTGGYISPAEAEAFYLAVVADPALAEAHWHQIPPVVQILAIIFNGELSDRAWDWLPQWAKVVCLKSTDEKVELVRKVVRDLVIEIENWEDEHDAIRG